jgi:hypothetical protein
MRCCLFTMIGVLVLVVAFLWTGRSIHMHVDTLFKHSVPILLISIGGMACYLFVNRA